MCSCPTRLREKDEERVLSCVKSAATIIHWRREHAAADARAAAARQADAMRDVTPEALHVGGGVERGGEGEEGWGSMAWQ
jgi:hypothetical protein